MSRPLWVLEKYARYKINKEYTGLGTENSTGSWQQFVGCTAKPIQLQIKEPLHIVLQIGEDVFETIPIGDSKKYLKAVTRDDNMLFFYKIKNNIRRFRIKFGNTDSFSSIKNCENFVDTIKAHVNIQTVENNSTNSSQSQSLMSKQVESGTSQKPMEVDEERLNENDSFQLQKKSLSLLAKSVLSNNRNEFPEYYHQTNLTVDENKSSSLIQTCLLDPNFPEFVSEVEKILKNMTRDEE